MAVRILNVGLEEDPDTGEIIIRGVLDQETLKFINMAWYQREQGFSNRHTNEIISGLFLNGRVSDITLGMRGARCQSKGSTYTLQDKVYCIDGGQRLYAAAAAMRMRSGIKLHIGAKVYLNTTEESENEMFCRLGTTQVRISASVLMRNQKKKSTAVETLLALNTDDQFALKERIGWGQTKAHSELMTGFTLAKIIGALHAHQGGALKAHKVSDLVSGMDRLVDRITAETLRKNVIGFFDSIDRCWNIRNLTGAHDEVRPQLNTEFLLTIASVLSRYPDFWEGTERTDFFFADRHVKRLKGFRFADYIRQRPPRDILFEIIRKRLNLDPVFEEAPTVAGVAAA